MRHAPRTHRSSLQAVLRTGGPGPLAALLVLLAACAGTVSPRAERARDLIARLEPVSSVPEWADPSRFETARESAPAPATSEYRLGPGDELQVHVVGHPDLTGRFTVGPDGRIGFPLLGSVDARGRTRDELAGHLGEGIAPFLATAAVVTVDVTHYENNKVYVLGRVEQPGQVELNGSGCLLQALAEAGGLPVREFRAFLSRAAIVRGSEEILWIDLIDLLQNGNVALNVPLRNGDVVFVPDSEDATVFVMGAVTTPGAVPIKARIRLTQALAQAGGPTEDADLEQVYVLRPQGAGEPVPPLRVDLAYLLESGDFTENLELRTGDVVYVGRSGMGDVNYVLRKLVPGAAVLAVGAAAGAR